MRGHLPYRLGALQLLVTRTLLVTRASLLGAMFATNGAPGRTTNGASLLLVTRNYEYQEQRASLLGARTLLVARASLVVTSALLVVTKKLLGTKGIARNRAIGRYTHG